MVRLSVMKTLLILILLVLTACTRKYADYDLIRKIDFNKEVYERPVTVMQVVPAAGKKDFLDACFNQWLFFSNAAKEKDQAIPLLVRSLCPGHDYLLGSELVESWWTTLVFTRSCVSVQTTCADLKK
jgi:hypothetical protein